jgi:hypothetical protein
MNESTKGVKAEAGGFSQPGTALQGVGMTATAAVPNPSSWMPRPEPMPPLPPVHQNEIAFVPLPMRPPLHFEERQPNAARTSEPTPLPPAASTHEPPGPLHLVGDDRLGGFPPSDVRVVLNDGVGVNARDTSPRTIVAAVVRNQAEIDLLAASFLELIDVKLEALRQQRSNSDEAAAEIADYEDLKQRVEAFLDRASQFVESKTDETSVVIATKSFAQGLSNWWSKRQVGICDQAYGRILTGLDMAIFGIGVDICIQAGATGALAIAIPGVVAGGDRVLQAVKAIMGSKKGKAD